MATLGKAVVELSADTAKFIGDIGRAAATFDKSMAGMQTSVLRIRDAMVAAAGLGGIGLLVKGAIDAGDELNKLSQKVGFSVESLSMLKLGAELADVGLDQLKVGLKVFNQQLVEASNQNSKASRIFKALGVDIRSGPEVALRQTAEAFSRLRDGEIKSTAATALFGKAALDLIPWLNGGAKGMDEAADKARALGLVMGPEFAKQAEQFNDNLKLLQKTSAAFGMSIAKDTIDPLTTITGNLAKAAEKGELLLGILREIAKLVTAGTAKALEGGPLGLDVIAMLADRAASSQFGPQGGGRLSVGKIGGLPAKTSGGGPNPAALAAALSSNPEAELKRFLSAQQELEERLGKLNSQTQEEITLNRTLKGSWVDLTSQHKVVLLNLSVEIDARNRLQRAIKADLALRDEVNDNQAEYLQGLSSIDRAHADQLEGYRRQLDPLREMRQENEGILSVLRQYTVGIYKDVPEAAKTIEMLNDAWEAHNIKLTLAEAGMNTYGEATNRVQDIGKSLGAVLVQAADDALFRWEGFGDFLKNLDRQLAQVIMRAAIIKPFERVAENIGGNISEFIFGKSGLGIPSFDVGSAYVPRDMLAMVHQGEAIIPASQNRGGANAQPITVNVTVVESQDPRRTAAIAVQAVRRAFNRAGMATALG